MFKAEKDYKIQGPNGEKLRVAWMSDGRIQIEFSSRVAVSAFFPGSGENPKPKIVIHQI